MTTSPIKKRIGIIGGMGPEATILLMMRIMKLTPAKDDSDHVPLIIDNNTQVPSRIKALIENSGEDPGPILQQMAVQLESNGAQALAMPCNTAHYYANQIKEVVNVPFLNMLDLCAGQLSASLGKNKTVGVLGSPAVMKLKLFDDAFAKQDIAVIYPQDQTALLSAIRAIKSDSQDLMARSIFQNGCRELADRGADILLIGCSEFSIINDTVPATLQYLDAIDVLAQSVVDFACRTETNYFQQA